MICLDDAGEPQLVALYWGLISSKVKGRTTVDQRARKPPRRSRHSGRRSRAAAVSFQRPRLIEPVESDRLFG